MKPMSAQESEMSPQQPRKRGPILWVLLAAIVIGLAALMGFLAGRSSASPQIAADSEFPISMASEEEASQSQSAVDPQPVPTQMPTAAATESEPTPNPSPTPLPTEPPPTATADVQPGGETASPDESNALENADFTVLYEVWDIIEDHYDGEIPFSEEVLESIISGSLETLGDDYTRYVPPDVAERMRQDQDGSVEGIGAYVQENDEGMFEIVRPIDGQPADLAGIKAGDILIEIDGQSIVDFRFDEVILMVRGPEGTTVNLKFLREGVEEPLEFSIVRTRFEVPTVEFEVLPQEIAGDATIGYIRLTEFNSNAEERLLEALDALLDEEITGLVFDLRDNPGGFLDQSVAVADAFLPDGVALFERNIRGLDETFRTDDGDVAETIPLVVLVNSGSASASEIVAGAIQDRDRAVLVGETTFGKGSVQQIHPLTDGSELRVTIARWYTPGNHTIDGVGIVPDIEVATPEDLGGQEDGQLARAVEFLLTDQ